jgi:hypothetical protein
LQIGSGGEFARLNFSHSREKSASAKSSLPDFTHSRDKSSCEKFSRSAPGASFARRPRFAGFAAYGGMPGAFCHGIVKVQQGSAAEPFPISSGAKSSLRSKKETAVNRRNLLCKTLLHQLTFSLFR